MSDMALKVEAENHKEDRGKNCDENTILSENSEHSDDKKNPQKG